MCVHVHVCFVVETVLVLTVAVSMTRVTQMTESARDIDAPVRMGAHPRIDLASTNEKREGVRRVGGRRVTQMFIRTVEQSLHEDDLRKGGGLPPHREGIHLVALLLNGGDRTPDPPPQIGGRRPTESLPHIGGHPGDVPPHPDGDLHHLNGATKEEETEDGCGLHPPLLLL